MIVYRFKHPAQKITYSWNTHEGLLYKNDDDAVFLDRSTNRGELLFRFLEFKSVNQLGFSTEAKETQTEIITRTYVPKIMELLGGDECRQFFIKTIRNYGYKWLPVVEKIEVEDNQTTVDKPGPGSGHDHDAAVVPLFLHERSEREAGSFLGHIIDASELVREKSREFVGRDYVFDRVDEFMNNNDHGHFVIQGDPGIGKTALMTQLLLKWRCVHHFNVRAEGISRTDLFLRNLCAQLILKYRLPYADLPPEATRDASFFKELLAKISMGLAEGEQTIILVDALDEVDVMGTGANTLFLPLTLPRGIYIISGTRRTNDVKLRFDCAHTFFNIEHDAAYNLYDVALYIESRMGRVGITRYIENQKLDSSSFLDLMTEKSEGNFMYLRYVLPEIENGVYRNRPIADVPRGLYSYYEDHWCRMRGADEDAWFNIKLPVVLALSIIREPVSIHLVSKFSSVSQLTHIRNVLNGWRQFLHIRRYSVEPKPEKRYRIYHASYQDFISTKDEVQDQALQRGIKCEVDLKVARRKIANVLVKDLIDSGILGQDFEDGLLEDK